MGSFGISPDKIFVRGQIVFPGPYVDKLLEGEKGLSQARSKSTLSLSKMLIQHLQPIRHRQRTHRSRRSGCYDGVTRRFLTGVEGELAGNDTTREATQVA